MKYRGYAVHEKRKVLTVLFERRERRIGTPLFRMRQWLSWFLLALGD